MEYPLSHSTNQKKQIQSKAKTKEESVSCSTCLPPRPKGSNSKQKRVFSSTTKAKPCKTDQQPKEGNSGLAYSPSGYALNFDDDRLDKENDPYYPSFSSRFASPQGQLKY
ncbi:Uncharacterized protein TCM_032894 [Theobroma cacao]|uniref:Uncharacterized protein n=1 Tax=Theobroma cacao TaxID=3641 RepID=A0A061FB39_THECC|nr:Uncharacterized protein TCM_032894 [Theobroma cacao]